MIFGLLPSLLNGPSLLPIRAGTPRAPISRAGRQTAGAFAAVGDHFELNGKPFVIRSGEMHYPRVPRAYWRTRFRQAKAMGLNTICTYVFWNLHETSPGHFDFTGNLDLAEYLRVAQQEGMYIVLRPGPYICTEEDLGGLPSRLLKDHSITIRSRDPKFLAAADKYLAKVGEVARPFLIQNGGPILMTQVENEYGSYGNDHVYTNAIKESLIRAGFTGQLFTSDGPGADMLNGGTLPGIPASVNFGGGGPGAIAELKKFRPDGPKAVGEYWCGWFDHWGERHHRTGITGHVKDIEWFLANGVSFNLYMFHGGTSFGFLAGANGDSDSYEPDTTSYDYDSPVDESGRPTAKYFAFREAIAKATGEKLPPVPSVPKPMAIPNIPLVEAGPLISADRKPVLHDSPLTFEDLDQAYGFVRYETTTPVKGDRVLKVDGLRDYALVYVNGALAGTLDRRDGQTTLPVHLTGATNKIEIWAEVQARINFGHALAAEREGITKAVTLDGQELKGWAHFRYPLTQAPERKIPAVSSKATGPVVYQGVFSLSRTGDTFLDLGDWTKGYVWVNGHNLGRFWSAGPQRTLFLPGCWLKAGQNRIAILEEGKRHPGTLRISALDHALLDGDRPPVAALRKPGQSLKLEGLSPVAVGEFPGNNGWKTLPCRPGSEGRYVAFQFLSEQTGGPFASAAELQVLDAEGREIPHVKVTYADSEELESENGAAGNLLDHHPDTMWHSEWGNAQPGFPHQIVLDLGSVQRISAIRYLPRSTGVNGRVKNLEIYVSPRPFPGL